MYWIKNPLEFTLQVRVSKTERESILKAAENARSASAWMREVLMKAAAAYVPPVPYVPDPPPETLAEPIQFGVPFEFNVNCTCGPLPDYAQGQHFAGCPTLEGEK